MKSNRQLEMVENFSKEYKKQLIKYLFQCIASESSKLLLFSIFFMKIDLLKEFGFALTIIILLRMHGGGIHFRHYLTCLFVSFSVFGGSIFLGIYVPLPIPISTIIISICTILGYLTVPVTSDNRPSPSCSVVRKSKNYTVLILLIYFMLICIVPTNPYINIGTWSIIIHISQLLLAKFIKGGRKTCWTD